MGSMMGRGARGLGVRVMAFFRAPGVPWLYSGALMTNPSNEAISAAHCLVLVLALAY